MALAAFLKWFLTLLVEVLVGTAVLDVQWVSRGVTGLLGLWDRHGGNNRGADGCAEALFSVLETQGGEAAGDSTTRILSAHTAVKACASRASLLSSPLQADCVQRQGCGTLPSALLHVGPKPRLSSVYWNGYLSSIWLLATETYWGEQQGILMELAIWFWM